MNNPAHSIAVLNCGGNANRPELSRTVPSRAEPYRTMQWKSAIENLTWTTHIQTQVKKARQRLYHLRQLRKFRVSPAILKMFSVWYSNATNQDCKALQRIVRLAERISGSALPSLQDIYFKRCKSRDAKIIKDSNHPVNHLFCLLPSGKRFRSMMAKTERLRRSFFPQAPKLCLITFTGLNLINCKIFTILHHPHCCYIYIPGTTCLHIPLAHPCLYYYLLSPQYTLLHILLFIFYLYLYIFSCVVLHILHCPLSEPDLTYISLLIIFCIIEYVTHKKTLNLEHFGSTKHIFFIFTF